MFYIVAVGGALAGRGADGGFAAAVLAILSAVIGKRLLRGDIRYAELARWTRKLAILGGTRFRGADLTGASFQAARLKTVDFEAREWDPSN